MGSTENMRNLLSTANKSRNPAQVADAFDKLARLLTDEDHVNACIESGGIAATMNSLTKPQRSVQLSVLKLLAIISISLDVRRTLEKQNKYTRYLSYIHNQFKNNTNCCTDTW
jgi:hypothetical protein